MSQDPKERLPDELVWAAGGHVSDVVLTALADGQFSIVPGHAQAHVESCPVCTMHLGHAALLSLHAAGEIDFLVEEPVRVPWRSRLPRLPIALGLAVAALGFAPSLFTAPTEVRNATHFVTDQGPVFFRVLATMARRLTEADSASGLAFTYGTSALLVLIGFAAVRLLPQKEVSQ